MFLNPSRSRFSSRSNNISQVSLLEGKRRFWRWFKDQPELSSPVSIRVNDTIQSVEFYKPDGSALGRNKMLEAQRFWEENFMDERLKSIWFDAIGTGEGFGWKGFVSMEQLKEVLDTVALKNKSRYNTKELYNRLFLKSMDEDLRSPRVFDYVPSSTVLVDADTHDVTGYTQYVGNQKVEFDTKEIVHFMFQRLDGKAAGHTPVIGLRREMILLWFIKENMLGYVRNGGLPNKIFTLPKEQANSENHKLIESILIDYNAVENRNGNLVLTGEVDVQDMNEKLRDLEYKDLALWVTSNIAYALQIPVTRIPYLIGTSSTGGDGGGLADSGYWSMIEADQKKIENLMNTQVFKDMGFIMRFRKRYKLDDLRETQALTMRADGITKIQSILLGFGKRLTPGKVLSMMDMNHSDVEDLSPEDMMNPMEKSGLMNQNMLNNIQMEGDNMVKRDGKRTEQVNNPSGGANKPGGL